MALLSQKTGLPSFSAVDASIVNYFTDPGFERGTDGTLPDGWLQYNDGAVAVPVDGTGGSANASVTLLTTTAGAIRGTKSALLTKGPGNQQGTGYSYDFTISNVDKGVTAGVDFELVTSAAYVSGDVVFYIYDVTNSILITPRAVSLPALPNYGKFFTDYGLQTGTQYRFILHIATTNASAWTITLDTMTNSTTRAVPGSNVGNTENVPVTGSWVTNTTYTAKRTVVGEWAHYQIKVAVTGAPTATALIVNLPSGDVIDTNNLANSDAQAGNILPNSSVGIVDISTASYAGGVYYNNTTSVGILWTDDDAVATKFFAVSATAPMTWASGDSVTISFRVPLTRLQASGTFGPSAVTQWASDDGTSDVLGPQGSLVPNVAFGTGQTSRIFSFSVPQDLRQFVRTEINYRGNGWQSAADLFPNSQGNNGSASNYYGIQSTWDTPTNYRVFFGNRGTNVAASNVDNGSIAWASEFAAGTRFRVGLSIGGVFIGINLATETQAGFYPAKASLSRIRGNTVAGYGSTNTTILRFTNVTTNSGSGITYASSATLGDSFTCTEAGIYSFTYSCSFNTAGANFGISLNSSQLTSSITSITVSDRLISTVSYLADVTTAVAWTGYLVSGDVVRFHADGNPIGAIPGRSAFTVQRNS